MKAVGIAAPASEELLLSESEPELPPELPVEEELPPVLVVEPALERLVLRVELELLKVPLEETGMVPLVGMRVPVPRTVGAEVMEVALAMAAVADASALLTSEEAAAVMMRCCNCRARWTSCSSATSRASSGRWRR